MKRKIDPKTAKERSLRREVEELTKIVQWGSCWDLVSITERAGYHMVAWSPPNVADNVWGRGIYISYKFSAGDGIPRPHFENHCFRAKSFLPNTLTTARVEYNKQMLSSGSPDACPYLHFSLRM